MPGPAKKQTVRTPKAKKPVRVLRLNKTEVDALQPEAARYDVWDTLLESFGVRVGTTGAKTFFVRYRPGGRGTTHRRATLGRYGVLTLEQARNMARKLMGKVADGQDPAAPSAKNEAPTVADLVDRFKREHIATKVKPTTARTYKLILNNEVLPKLGKLKVSDVTRAHVAKLHHAMRDTPRHANQTLSVLSKMFRLAELWEYRPAGNNPGRGIQRYPEAKRDRVPTPEEVAALGKAIRAAEKAQTLNFYALQAIRLLLFLGMRKSEVLNLRWEEVDLRARVLKLGDSKTGQIMVNLNDEAYAVLERLWGWQVLGNSHVLPGLTEGGKLGTLRSTWDSLRETAHLGDLRLHDLRHHLGTEGAMLGMSEAMIGALLNHKTPAMTRRYINLANKAKADASNQLGAAIAAKLGEKKRKA